MNEEYCLRCSLQAHSEDVRAVKRVEIPHGGIVSGSRDRTIKVWTPNMHDPEYSETHCMMGPSHFIASLCTLPPSTQYPSGLILAGSNDCAIYGFSLDSSQPILKLLGHSSTVCSLVAGNFGAVVSGSWDKTARIWHGQKCVMILEGHQEAVWAVEMFRDQGLTLTASADKSVRLWRAGNCEKIFNGHEDCVRGLAVLSAVEFLSCSNDCTVRMWQTNGNCIGVFCGHTNYIYSIDLLNDKGDFVTSSEDQTIKIWREGICVQTIKLPAQSLWATACLENEDIAVGGSDGTLRIFTRHKELKASPSQILEFTNEVLKASQPKKKDMVGDLKLDDLPGAEALLIPGSRDGQTMLCRDGDSVCVYQWSVLLNKWSKFGDVLDATDAKKKVTFEGKEYDYIFTIDVEEKYLKLPYNVEENPWMAAQKFIEKHNLSQLFLDDIAKFIIANSDGASRPTTAATTSGFVDPFTGANRYVPSDISSPGTSASAAAAAARNLEKNDFFPQTSYLRFDSANIEGLENKLIEFSDQVAPNLKLSQEEIKDLLKLSNFPDEVTDDQMSSLDRVMSWPNEYVFPALDLFRLAVRSEVMNEKVGQAGGVIVANYLMRFLIPPNPPSNNMLVLRTFCNFFGHATGEHLLVDHMEKVCVAAANCLPAANKNVQIAVATLFLNYAVALQKSVFTDSYLISDNVLESIKHLTEPEAVFRLIVCIGTLMENPSANAVMKSSGILHFLEQLVSSNWPPKILECTTLLLEKLR